MTHRKLMTPEQRAHMHGLMEIVETLMERRYTAGQAEHGGNLWDLGHQPLLDSAIEEAIDLLHYLLTARYRAQD